MKNKLGEEPSHEDMAKAVDALKTAAMGIYEMLDPGMSIVVSLPEKSAVVVPGRPQKMRTLIITKPALVMTIAPKGVE